MPPHDDRAQARAMLDEHLARAGFSDSAPVDLESALAAIAPASSASGYAQLDAALWLALRGDARAVATLRQVFDGPHLAVTNSLHEQGYAALGLALLGDVESVPRLRAATPINLNRVAVPLALRLLGA
jgi:hypothetical protein